MTFEEEERYRRVVLEGFEVGCRKNVSCAAMLNANQPELLLGQIGMDLAIQMRIFLGALKLPQRTVKLEVVYPATWWQALKHQYFPKWALKWWPVKNAIVTQEHIFETTVVYPDIPFPAHRKVLLLNVKTGPRFMDVE